MPSTADGTGKRPAGLRVYRRLPVSGAQLRAVHTPPHRDRALSNADALSPSASARRSGVSAENCCLNSERAGAERKGKLRDHRLATGATLRGTPR